MTTFAHKFVTKWKDGQAADWTGATVIVSFDQTNTAYDISDDDREAFEDWVAVHWAGDNDEQDDDESTANFLDRIDVQIREA